MEYGNKVSQTKTRPIRVYECSFERYATFYVGCLEHASSETSYIPSKMLIFFKTYVIFPDSEKTTNK